MVLAGWPGDHPVAAADAVKAPLRGLISMGAYRFAPALGEPDNSLDTVRQKPGLLQGIVILASWRSLEPSPTSGLADNNEIDQGLANVRKYNQHYPNTPLAVKIRVWGGFWAPDWVMQDSGGKIPVVHQLPRRRQGPRVGPRVGRQVPLAVGASAGAARRQVRQ
jgi:hypothetical protein